MGATGVTVSVAEQEWQELCVRLLGVTMLDCADGDRRDTRALPLDTIYPSFGSRGTVSQLWGKESQRTASPRMDSPRGR